MLVPPDRPGFFKKLNYIIWMSQSACGNDWTVVIKTARSAALDVLVQFLCFDLGDVARWLFRPSRELAKKFGKIEKTKRGGHSGFYFSKNRRRGKFSPSKWVKNRLPPLKRLEARKVSNGVLHLWRIDGILQRFLFWWMVVDLAEDFLYRWTSSLYATERCQTKGVATASGVLDPVPQSSLFGAPIPLGFKYDETDDPRVNTAHTGGSMILVPGIVVAAGVNLQNPFPNLPGIARLQITTANRYGVTVRSSDWIEVPHGQTVDLAVDATSSGPSSWSVALAASNTVRAVDGIIMVTEIAGRRTPPPPASCDLEDILSF